MATANKAGAKCRCGRTAFPPHCPMCGSGSIYSRRGNDKRLRVPDQNGVEHEVFAQGFVCRRCHADFHDLLECGAPPPNVGRGLTGAQQKALEHLKMPPGETKRLYDFIEKVKVEKGIEQPQGSSNAPGGSTPKMDSVARDANQGDTSTGGVPPANEEGETWPLPNE